VSRVSALDLLFPPRCAACGDLLVEAAPLCEPCHATLVPLPDQGCPVCAEPLEAPGPCMACRDDPPPFERVRAAFAFGGAAAEALVRFKYRDAPTLAGPLAELAWPALGEGLRGCDAIAPIPLHPTRLRQRGFDQAALLAQALAARAGRPCALDLLVRTRATPQQVGAARADRHQNLRGAFRAGPRAPMPKRVALVDDVVTTTATARDAARALREAGVEAVHIAAIARAYGSGK